MTKPRPTTTIIMISALDNLAPPKIQSKPYLPPLFGNIRSPPISVLVVVNVVELVNVELPLVIVVATVDVAVVVAVVVWERLLLENVVALVWLVVGVMVLTGVVEVAVVKVTKLEVKVVPAEVKTEVAVTMLV